MASRKASRPFVLTSAVVEAVGDVRDQYPCDLDDARSVMHWLKMRTAEAILTPGREVYDYMVPVGARAGVPIMRDCVNLAAIELMRKLLETDQRLTGDSPERSLHELRDMVDQVLSLTE